MKLRSRHLVLLLLLISTAHFAEGSDLSAGGLQLSGSHVGEFLTRLAPMTQPGQGTALGERLDRTDAVELFDLPAAALFSARTVWTMPEPVAQATAVESATGRGGLSNAR
jgi:hypothetical protein